MASLSNINGIFDVHSTGAILFSNTHGTSGQILRSNGNAAPTWVAASTVIGGPYLPLTGGTLTGNLAINGTNTLTVGGATTLNSTLAGTSATFSGDLTVTGNQYFNGTEIQGDGKTMLRYSDAWLRINEDNDFTSGIYCGTGKLRTDGQFEVGGSGAKFKVTSAGVVTALGNITAPSFNGLAINTTGTNNVANQIVRTEANGYVNFGWINSISGATTSTITRITASNDAYLRYVTPATFRSQITDPYYAPTGTVSGVTSVGGTGTVSGLTLTGTVTSTGNITLGGAISGFTELNMIRSLGTTAFTNGANPNITTAQVMAEIEADGGFDSYSSVFKTSWSYAGNYNLVDAGDFTETAGSSWITWTDNSSDTTRGRITTLAIAPNTGGSAGGVFIYNDQGSSYSPGWRQVWTSRTDGSGSGLDADLLDGQEGSYYAPASSLGNYLPLAGGTVTGSTDFTAGTYPLEVYGIGSTASSSAVGLGIYGSSSAGAIMHFHRPGAYAVNFGLDSDNIMRIGGWSANANRWFLDMSGNNTVAGSYRAPIFYDSLNTAYYGDFAGQSSMYGVAVRGDLSSTATGNQIFFWGSGNQTTSAIGFKANGGNFVNPTGNGDGYNTYLTMDTNGRGWVFRRGTGGSNFTSAFNSGWILNDGNWQANTSMRAPIFYDSGNTAYLGDFDSYTYGKYYGRRAHNEGFQVGGYNNVGANDAASNPIYTIGSSYMPASTTLSNMYGIGYTHSNASFIGMVGASGWGMYVASDGDARVYLDGGNGRVSATGAMYSPIYYDTNTSYYGNFASTSRLNTLNCDGAITSGTSSTGNIYCGKSTSTHFRFHTVSNTTYFDMNSGTINWRQGSSTRYWFYPSSASMTINGTLTQNSDIRVKENIIEISDCISKVQGMRGVYYNRTDFNTEVTKVGVIAQEVEAVLPELILENTESGLKSVAYGELTAVLINAVKEQQVIIDDLKSRIEKLEL